MPIPGFLPVPGLLFEEEIGGNEADVTWSPTNKGTDITLENNNLDARTPANQSRVVASSHGLTNTSIQKAYLEVIFVRSHESSEVGIKDQNFSNLGTYHYSISGNNVHFDNYYQEFERKGSGWTLQVSSSQSRASNGTVIMWALDRSAGKIWFGRDGNWVYSGDPVAGTSQTFNAVITNDWYASCNPYGNSIIRIVTKAADFSYSPPTGFVSFAEAVA